MADEGERLRDGALPQTWLCPPLLFSWPAFRRISSVCYVLEVAGPDSAILSLHAFPQDLKGLLYAKFKDSINLEE